MDKNFTFFNYLFKKWRNSLHDLHFKTLIKAELSENT